MQAEHLSEAQQLSLTILPQAIIETILCLLPVAEAARTSILSREWRYKWATIPKLVFFQSTFKKSTEAKQLVGSGWEQMSYFERARIKKDMRHELFYAIHQVLLLRRGPIHDFILSMCADDNLFELDQIILHLSHNHTIKKLTLKFFSNAYGQYATYGLPSCVFSMHQLTDLSLKDCKIDHKPVFNGFGSLTSLSLEMVWINIDSLLHLLSLCPSLKSLNLFAHEANLGGYRSPTYLEFFECLPVIEHLTTTHDFVELGLHVWVPKELTTSLIHLKYFCFKEMIVDESSGWTFLYYLIQCSPNLKKIKLEMLTDVDDRVEGSITFEEYSDVWLEHLNELEVNGFRNLKPELEFVKFIMARSPNLKKVMLLTSMDDMNEELEMLSILLSAPRASPVRIMVKNGCRAQR